MKTKIKVLITILCIAIVASIAIYIVKKNN